MKTALFALMLMLQSSFDVPSFDNKLREIDYEADRITRIEAAVGYQATVLLSPDEKIDSIAVGDTSAWQVNANKSGNIIFVKLSSLGFETNMTVITNVRIYSFELVPIEGGASAMPYVLKFNYPSAQIAEETINPGTVLGRYKVSGTRSLYPSGIVDDGYRTFIEWPKSADIPAVYAIDQSGKEVLVNGMMRQDRLVIESVASRLVFRIDKKVARATRRQVEERK